MAYKNLFVPSETDFFLAFFEWLGAYIFEHFRLYYTITAVVALQTNFNVPTFPHFRYLVFPFTLINESKPGTACPRPDRYRPNTVRLGDSAQYKNQPQTNG